MILRRHTVVLLLSLTFCMAWTPMSYAKKKAYIPQFKPPVQNYAVIDISSTKQGSNAVDQVALNDSNSAAFSFYSTDGSSYTSFQFANGVATQAQNIDLEIDDYTDLGETVKLRFPNLIDSSGNVYSTETNQLYDLSGYIDPQWSGDIENDGPLGMPFPYQSTDSILNWVDVGAVSDNGYCGYGFGALPDATAWGGFKGASGGIIQSGSSTIIFDPAAVNAGTPSAGVQVNGTSFHPVMINNSGSAIGSFVLGPAETLWNGQTFTELGDVPADFNDQNQVVISTWSKPEGYLWENGSTTTFRDTLPFFFEYQDRDIRPSSISNQVKPLPQDPTDKSIHVLSDAVGFDVGTYGKILWTRDNNGKWNFGNVAVPQGPTITDWDSINSSGVIAAIGNGGHALLLLPVSLTNIADPAKQHNNLDTPIAFKHDDNDTDIGCVAWIAAHDPNNSNAPRMPKLQAKMPGLSGCAVYWKLQVTFHDRHGNPHRDFDTGDPYDLSGSGGVTPDTVTIPKESNSTDPHNENGWHKITDGTPWNIYDSQDSPDWASEVANGFFGGDAVLSVKATTADGNTVLLPQRDFKFRIAGENPDETLCKNYICAKYGGPAVPTRTPPDNTWHGFWFAYAIAREETAYEGGNRHYNNFMDNGSRTRSTPNPGHEGMPDWNDDGTNSGRTTGTGGYGIFQHTYEESDGANYIMPRNWIWNWQANVDNYAAKFNIKYNAGLKTYNGLIATYQSKGYPDIQNEGNFSGLEALVITFINGGGGKTTTLNLQGLGPRLTCWYPKNGSWQFLVNFTKPNGYVAKVNDEVNK